MRIGFIILVATMLTLAGTLQDLGRTAEAQEPTPTLLTELGLDASAVVGLIGASPTIRWSPVSGVDHFRLTATLLVIRVNGADPVCSAPAQPETRTISIDEQIPAATNMFTVSFPALTGGDAWFVFNAQLRLDAVDALGQRIGSQGGGGVADATCARPTPSGTRVPGVALPGTGTGPEPGNFRLSIYASAIVLILAGLAVCFTTLRPNL